MHPTIDKLAKTAEKMIKLSTIVNTKRKKDKAQQKNDTELCKRFLSLLLESNKIWENNMKENGRMETICPKLEFSG